MKNIAIISFYKKKLSDTLKKLNKINVNLDGYVNQLTTNINYYKYQITKRDA